jgi:SNF2 family DNA or RNA helicase
VLLISYESILKYEKIFNGMSATKSMLICDEGHRLKNHAGVAFKAINGMSSIKRLLMTGTPVQNNLTEFWSMATFSNRDVLGDLVNARAYWMCRAFIRTSRPPSLP